MKIKRKSFFELKKQDKPNENNSTSSDIPISNLNQLNQPGTPPFPPPRPPSKKKSYTINTFIALLDNDVDELFKLKQTFPRSNILQHKKNVASEFFKLKVNAAILHAEVYGELKDEKYYKRILHDPTHEHMKIVDNIIETIHRQQVLGKKTLLII